MFDFVAGTIVASSLMDKKGRKRLLITSFSGMVIITFNSHISKAESKTFELSCMCVNDRLAVILL